MFDSNDSNKSPQGGRHFKVPASYEPDSEPSTADGVTQEPEPEAQTADQQAPAAADEKTVILTESDAAEPAPAEADEKTVLIPEEVQAPVDADEKTVLIPEAVQAPADADAPVPGASPAPASVPEIEKTQVAPAAAEPAPQPIGVVTPLPSAQTYQNFANPADLPMPTVEAKHRGKAGVAVGIIVAGLAAAYAGVSLYFGSHFLPNTTVDGIEVSYKTADDLASQLDQDSMNFSTTVSGQSLNFQVNGSDIGLAYNSDSYAQDALSQQNGWTWPAAFFDQNRITATQAVTYDADKLSAIVKTATDQLNATAAQPTNANLVFDSTSKTWTITPDAVGTAVDPDAVLNQVTEGVSTLQKQIEIDDSVLLQPTVRADDPRLTASLDKANKLAGATISLTVKGAEVAQVSSDQINGWLGVDSDYNLTVNTDAITTWAKGDLSKALDSVNTQRTYTRPDGKQVTVSGGTYGWNIDGATLAQTIATNLDQVNTAAIEVPMKSEAATWAPGGQDWTNRYLDVDLSEQHVYFYDETGTVIWESDLVSGDPTENNQTPQGVYFVDAKSTNQTLKGLDENHDNEPDYVSHVDYWMPFIGNLVAFHDAGWRSTFGGTVNQGNGSHGCINLPYKKAADLYNIVQVGDVVVTHM